LQVVSTLLEAGLWAQGAHEYSRDKVLKILEDARESAGGLVGFGELSLISSGYGYS